MLKSSYDNASEFRKRFEKIPTLIYENSNIASVNVANEISNLIKAKQKENKPCVLGLATGSTPISLYKELIKLHKKEGLSFKNVITFNLDEYYPMNPQSHHSYRYFMYENLFNHIDILHENINIPKGNLKNDEIVIFCQEYEEKIDKLGGLDLQILGIGHNGHIGFNEPGSLKNSKTRLVALEESTRRAASEEFLNLNNTPKTAITLGIKQILLAKKLILMAWGDKKAKIILKSVEENITPQIPASYLQEHQDCTFVLDKGSSSLLTRIDTPWITGDVNWDTLTMKKAIVGLALKLKKPILMLTDKDYIENGLSDLIAKHSNSYEINIDIFNLIQHTITGWPGGKPNADDRTRPERSKFPKKRVLIFSPHPDDDIISMGGTFMRLKEQGHDVHVAYQTSGNIAVADDETYRYLDFLKDFINYFKIKNDTFDEIYDNTKDILKNKLVGETEDKRILKIKGLIRRSEAKATCKFVGIPDENVHFLDLPFYETGKINKKPLSEDDFIIMDEIIDKIKPHQIFAAGDLADPHGTHKVCLDAVIESLKRLKHNKYMDDCWVWLYRGAWQEWDIHEIQMAVPMSPNEVLDKRMGIFKHQSQKDGVVFQGNDSREFWQRAEDRNSETARLYNQLGFAKYAAMEAFVRLNF